MALYVKLNAVELIPSNASTLVIDSRAETPEDVYPDPDTIAAYENDYTYGSEEACFFTSTLTTTMSSCDFIESQYGYDANGVPMSHPGNSLMVFRLGILNNTGAPAGGLNNQDYVLMDVALKFPDFQVLTDYDNANYFMENTFAELSVNGIWPVAYNSSAAWVTETMYPLGDATGTSVAHTAYQAANVQIGYQRVAANPPFLIVNADPGWVVKWFIYDGIASIATEGALFSGLGSAHIATNEPQFNPTFVDWKYASFLRNYSTNTGLPGNGWYLVGNGVLNFELSFDDLYEQGWGIQYLFNDYYPYQENYVSASTVKDWYVSPRTPFLMDSFYHIINCEQLGGDKKLSILSNNSAVSSETVAVIPRNYLNRGVYSDYELPEFQPSMQLNPMNGYQQLQFEYKNDKKEILFASKVNWTEISNQPFVIPTDPLSLVDSNTISIAKPWLYIPNPGLAYAPPYAVNAVNSNLKFYIDNRTRMIPSPSFVFFSSVYNA